MLQARIFPTPILIHPRTSVPIRDICVSAVHNKILLSAPISAHPRSSVPIRDICVSAVHNKILLSAPISAHPRHLRQRRYLRHPRS